MRKGNTEHMLYVLTSSMLGAGCNDQYFITLGVGGGLRSSVGELFPWTEWCICHLFLVEGAVTWDRNADVVAGRLRSLVGNLGGWAGEWQTGMAGADCSGDV